MRPCKRCNGEGTVFSKGFTTLEGKVYPDEPRVCSCCNGSKTFDEPNFAAIEEACTTSRGAEKGKRKFRAAWPGREHFRDHTVARAYYVWRLCRFHSGIDPTMPMTADLVVRADPYKPELDKLVDDLALKYLGNNIKGALRWGRAFGII